MEKDLKGAESIAEIIKLDLRDHYDTDKIFINVIATDINSYKLIIEVFNEYDEYDFEWNINNNLAEHEDILIYYINVIILDKYKRR